MDYEEARHQKAPPSVCMVHTIRCKHAEDMIDELLPTRTSWLRHHGLWTFRGQRDASWNLQARIFRDASHRHAGKEYSIAEVMALVPAQVTATAPFPPEHVQREFGLVMEFCDNLERLGLAIPFDSPRLRSEDPAFDIKPCAFPPEELRAMFALAQHYDIPTRLLDWTSKPLVAAYFAAVGVARRTFEEADQADNELAVWALNSALVTSWLRNLDPGVAVVTAPSVSNPNLHAQGGRFTLVQYKAGNDLALRDHPPPLDRLIEGYLPKDVPDNLHHLLPALVKLTLPAAEARSLLRLLADHEVTAAEVYPGHRGAAEAIREQKWMQWAREGERS